MGWSASEPPLGVLLILVASLGLLQPVEAAPREQHGDRSEGVPAIPTAHGPFNLTVDEGFGIGDSDKEAQEKALLPGFEGDSGHSPGGLPMISDSAFSLVTLIYVSVAFLVVFFMFCWKNEAVNIGGRPKTQVNCPMVSIEEVINANRHPEGAVAVGPPHRVTVVADLGLLRAPHAQQPMIPEEFDLDIFDDASAGEKRTSLRTLKLEDATDLALTNTAPLLEDSISGRASLTTTRMYSVDEDDEIGVDETTSLTLGCKPPQSRRPPTLNA